MWLILSGGMNRVGMAAETRRESPDVYTRTMVPHTPNECMLLGKLYSFHLPLKY